eukprot:EG_transcript_21075
MPPWDFCCGFVLGLLAVACGGWARARRRGGEPAPAPLPDPTDAVLVLIVRKDLKMGPGKQCAQFCHGAVGVHRVITSGTNPTWRHWLQFWERLPDPPQLLLRVDSEEDLLAARALARQANLPLLLVADAGRTQIARGSKTVLAVGPAPYAALEPITTRFPSL